MEEIYDIYEEIIETGLIRSKRSRFDRSMKEEKGVFITLDCRPYRQFACLVALQYRLNQFIEEYIEQGGTENENWKRGLLIIVNSNPPSEDYKAQRDIVNDYLKNLRPPIFISNKNIETRDGEWDQKNAGSLIVAPPALRRYCHYKMRDRQASTKSYSETV